MRSACIVRLCEFMSADPRRIHDRASCSLQNLQLVEKVKEIAARKGCTPGQLALAWVHAQGNDVFPIPGASWHPLQHMIHLHSWVVPCACPARQ